MVSLVQLGEGQLTWGLWSPVARRVRPWPKTIPVSCADGGFTRQIGCRGRPSTDRQEQRPLIEAPPRPASTTPALSATCCGSSTRRGPATRSSAPWPAGSPPRSPSTTRRPSPRCCGRCARPGPATRSVPWPTGPPSVRVNLPTPSSNHRRRQSSTGTDNTFPAAEPGPRPPVSCPAEGCEVRTQAASDLAKSGITL
jgi:hypothetical protein